MNYRKIGKSESMCVSYYNDNLRRKMTNEQAEYYVEQICCYKLSEKQVEERKKNIENESEDRGILGNTSFKVCVWNWS